MSKKIQCKNCQGQGTIKNSFVTCNICFGRKTGCRFCKGKGKVRETCHLCGGYGWYKLKEAKKPIYGRKRRGR